MANNSPRNVSAAIPLIRVNSPKWSSIIDFENGGFTFNNIFIYNFYTRDERDKYNFDISKFEFNHVGPLTVRREKFTIEGFTGEVRENKLLKLGRELIPRFVNLHWSPPEGFEEASTIAAQEEIDAFKFLVGLSDSRATPKSNNLTRSTPISRESFELQQMDFNDVTNEYLDMFAHSNGGARNQYFAEEVDDTKTSSRKKFIYDRIVPTSKIFKNSISLLGSSRYQPSRFPGNSLFEEQNVMDSDRNTIVDVNDSSLLENLNLPSISVDGDIIVALNSDFSWNVAQASSRNSGKILGMQTRIRNARYWKEYLLKYSNPGTTGYDEPDYRVRPIESIVANTFPYEVSNAPSNFLGQPEFKLVGFCIQKKQRIELENLLPDQISEFYFPYIFVACEAGSSPPTNYLDAAINYDKEYDYSIRAVFQMTFHIEAADGVYLVKYFINSTPSSLLTIETRETQMPSFPRDVWAFHEFYRENDGALALHWAFPVNKQRDTTYFAIFRRRSIYEPFQLLEIMDFNYSIKDPELSANEIKLAGFGRGTHDLIGDRNLNAFERDNINLNKSILPANHEVKKRIRRLSEGDPTTVYIDKDFKPDQDYMYAVCAIDAHGQISNYSSQIKVRLNSKPYKLNIQTISPPGAPLVFPNYFVSSKMFSDVARSSNFKTAKLRFRPDYKKLNIGTENNPKYRDIVKCKSQDPNNFYYLQFINPDRQEQVLLKYQIDDTFEVNFDANERRRVAEAIGIPIEDLIE